MSAAGMVMAPALDAAEVNAAPQWRLARRIAFRFIFSYLIIYQLPLPIGALPWTEGLQQQYESLWKAIVPWVGKHILHVASPISTASTGSGDRMYDWILALCYLTIAVAATLVWSTLDRRRANYQKLDQWLKLYIRFCLAMWMMTYGAAKVLPSQFSPPRFTRLIQPYGESSPMGLLWTFMGASVSYTVITGAVELLGGILLILPRTALLGALVSLAAMTQVFVLNMCYDVPVKLFSFHLILMCVLLLAPHARRIADFLMNRAVQPARASALFERDKLNRGALIFQAVFGLYLLGFSLFQGFQSYMRFGPGAAKPPLYGIWSVEEFSFNNELLPALLTDEKRWRRAIFQRSGSLVVQPMSGTNKIYVLNLDMENKKMALTSPENPDWKADFSFEEIDTGVMTVEGTLDGKQARAKWVRMDESQFLLKNRGFHWISEVPFNR